MHHEEWINDIFKDRTEWGLERTLREYPHVGGKFDQAGRKILNFSSNDALDLARHPACVRAAQKAVAEYGNGSTASRLMVGTLPLHTMLESRLAAFKGYPAALLFGSGYMTNLGIISALMGKADTIYADRLVHASIIDAVLLSRAKLKRFRHNDPEHLETLLKKRSDRGKRFIVTESVFSMDGDLAPLDEIARLAHDHEAMVMIDEAHATGIFGPHGSGRIRELGIESSINISMGTLSKALGGYGGYAACSPEMKRVFVNKARSFIYTTAPPPACEGGALAALDILESQPDPGAKLLRRATAFRQRLNEAGLNTLKSQSHIIPVWVGDNHKTLSLSRELAEKNILATAIRPPTVPTGSARLRFSITLAHTEHDVAQAAEEIVKIMGKQ